jgi:NADPH2:quinone reductase
MGPDCVEIAVAGAGLNPVDWKIMRGYLTGAFEHHLPIVPAWDVAGEVTAVGPSVTEFGVGDRVFAYARLDVIGHGTAADVVRLPVRVVAKAPESIDLVSAAAVPLAGLTAYQLVDRTQVSKGETVLVHNASGGVGQFAVQIAQARGARVIATASPANHDHLRALRAEPVAYGSGLPDAVAALAPVGIDVALDLIGGGALEQVPAHRYGSITDAQGVLALGGVYVFVRPSPADLDELSALIDAGQLRVDVAATYPFAEATTAYQRLEAGHVRGKIVLTP